ncbi:hypothetical protein EE612_010111 [Oryza sativa]|nr:hypothetical protein EE612_010111 [Oryza sativa]
MSSTAAGGAPGPAAQRHGGGGGGGGGCCSSGVTLELVGAFTAVCLVLYGVILYFNYLYVRWSGRDGVHRTSGGGGGGGAAARKRGGGGGLDKAALAAIPVFRFKASASAAALGGGEAECAVCLSGMQDGDAVRALPGCGHAFHAGCVDAWLRAHGTCPSAARAPPCRRRRRRNHPARRRRSPPPPPAGSRSTWRAKYSTKLIKTVS